MIVKTIPLQSLQCVPRLLADNVRRSLGAVRGRRRQAGRRVMDLGARTWLFLRELETEMKNWIAGVEMEVTELIQDAGYEVEVHEAVTEDGYILQLHRLPPRADGHGSPVYLQHGLLCSSACWVTQGRTSLAFVLHDLGYDVWLGNFRGNAYGRRHTDLDPDKDNQFWKFSVHEHATLDLPAGLRQCARVTGSKVSYVGHSMGTTSFLAMASSSSASAAAVLSTVQLAVLLAPVVEPYTMKFPLKTLAPVAAHPWFAYSFEKVGIQEFLPDWTLIKKLITAPWLQGVYAVLLRNRFDEEATEIMKRISNTFRTGRTSIYTVLHYTQMIAKKNFQAYNWSKETENLNRYNIPQPPQYRLDQVKVPVVIFWSDEDAFASVADVARLRAELPDLRAAHQLTFSHIDYLWGERAARELYHPLGDMLQQFIRP